MALPQAGTPGFGFNFVFALQNNAAGTATVTPTPPSTISWTDGTTVHTAQTSIPIAQGQSATFYSDNTNYFAVLLTGGGGSGSVVCSTQYYVLYNGSSANTGNCNIGVQTDSSFDFLISGKVFSVNGGYAAWQAAGGVAGTSGWLEFCKPGTAPTTFATGYNEFWCDSGTNTYRVNEGNIDSMSLTKTLNVNVTPVTVNANVTTDQNLMALTLHANDLNVVGRTLRIFVAGVYSTPAASTAQMTLKAKLCTVSGCGSGTVVTLASIQSGALPATAVTNNAIQMTLYPTTQTAGASSTFETHGSMLIDIAAAISAADSTYADQNTAVSSAIDTTGTLYLQIVGAFSAASASNSMTERQLTVEVLN